MTHQLVDQKFGDGKMLVVMPGQRFQLANRLLWVFDIQPRMKDKVNEFMTECILALRK